MKVTINRQLIGVEDLLLGRGTVVQNRGGQSVVITKLDLTSIPYDPDTGQTIAQYIQEQIADAQQMIEYVTVVAVEGETAEAVYDTVTNTITFTLPRGPQGIQGIQGVQGIQGPQGVSVVNFERTSGTGAPGTADTYTLTLSDSSTFDVLVYNGADGLGAGDMLKATYDTNNNGKVDVAETAESVEWTSVQNKPTIGDMLKATYDTNNNGKVDIAETAESVEWTSVQNKPTSYPPEAHNHDDMYYTETEVQTALPVIGFNTTTPTTPTQIGQIAWNVADGTLEVYLGNGVMLQFGLESLIPVKNNTASIITNGTICMATGSVGASGKITVAPMDGTVQSNADKIVGMATQDIAVGGFGFVTTQGTVRGIDTSGLTEEQPIYVSTTVIGGVTTTPPTTGMKLKVGQVIYSHATVGSVLFRTTILDENAYEPRNANIQQHISNTSNPHSVTKAQVGLGDVDNTSDASKPISTATQTALDLKAPLASPAFTGVPTAPTPTAGDNSTKVATTAFVSGALGADKPTFSAYRSAAQNISSSTWTKVQFNATDYNPNNAYDSTTNFRFQPTVAGYYDLKSVLNMQATSMTACGLAVYKNGVIAKMLEFIRFAATSSDINIGNPCDIYLNGSTDYVEVYAQIVGTNPVINSGSAFSYFSATFSRS